MGIARAELNQIKVASPCTESWGAMKGDDQVRFCGSCQQNVYNLSEMSLPEIAALLEKKEGRTCVRFYRRADGTVLTDDCPVGLRAVRRRMAWMAAAVASLLGTLGFGMFSARGSMARTLRESSLGRVQFVRMFADWLQPRPALMGEACSITMGAPPPMFTTGRVAVRTPPPQPVASPTR